MLEKCAVIIYRTHTQLVNGIENGKCVNANIENGRKVSRGSIGDRQADGQTDRVDRHQDISKILKISKSDGQVWLGPNLPSLRLSPYFSLSHSLPFSHSHNHKQRDKQDNTMFEYSRVLLTKGLRNYMLPTNTPRV